jgi:hypothetical protein
LKLSGTKIVSCFVEFSKNFPGLKSLSLNNCPLVTDDSVSTLSPLQLEKLSLNGCVEVSDASISIILKTCTTLLKLSVNQSRVTDIPFTRLKLRYLK